MVKIVWTELSISDLKEVYDYISEDSFRYAFLTTSKIYQRVQILIESPFSGRIVPEFDDKLVRELIEGNYRIIYRVKNDYQIDVLRIYHSARLLRKNILL